MSIVLSDYSFKYHSKGNLFISTTASERDVWISLRIGLEHSPSIFLMVLKCRVLFSAKSSSTQGGEQRIAEYYHSCKRTNRTPEYGYALKPRSGMQATLHTFPSLRTTIYQSEIKIHFGSLDILQIRDLGASANHVCF